MNINFDEIPYECLLLNVFEYFSTNFKFSKVLKLILYRKKNIRFSEYDGYTHVSLSRITFGFLAEKTQKT